MIIKDILKETINKILILSIAIVAVFLSYYLVSKNNNKLPQKPIVFLSSNNIWVMNSDGTDKKQLTDTGYDTTPSFNSNESKIVFSRKGEILTMDSSGNDQIVLVNNDEYSNGFPAWSPNGSKIVYVAAKSIKLMSYNEWQPIPYEIWIMDSDGNNKKKIFEDLKDKKDLSWNPDGSKISFKASIKEITQPEMYDLPYELWEINTDGSGLKQLTKFEE
ncbi:MAG: hypothetical protein Q8N37_01415 [bacterium]|nr:hypothetical protein [bacterium]